MAGRLITVSLALCKEVQCDERWQITRSPDVSDSLIWVPELGPGRELFEKYNKDWRYEDPQTWWPQYRQRFMDELESDEKKVFLRILWKKIMSGKTIALVCFCPNAAICHRSLVAEFLSGYGIETFEYQSVKPERISEEFRNGVLFSNSEVV